MRNLLSSTQQLVNDLLKNREMVVMSKNNFVSFVATLEEEMDAGSISERQKAEKEIEASKVKPLAAIITSK